MFIKIAHFEVSSSFVVVLKSNSSVKICGKLKDKTYAHIANMKYPLLNIEILMGNMSGSKCFIISDIKNKFFQPPVVDKTSKMLTISTFGALLTAHTLLFLRKFVPGHFQRNIEKIFKWCVVNTIHSV